MVNKYQAGGATPQGGVLQEIAKLPKDQLKKIMTAFGKWAQAKGLNVQQLQGNEQALEQAMTQFISEMQSAQKGQTMTARLGAKINYIRNLRGNAPEGQEVVYFKCGGQMKKKFVKKGAAGAKAEGKGMDAVKEFKKKKACGGVKMKFQPGGKTRTKAEQAKIDSLSQADYEAGYADHNVKYNVKKEEKKPVKKEEKKTPTKKPAKKLFGGLLGF